MNSINKLLHVTIFENNQKIFSQIAENERRKVGRRLEPKPKRKKNGQFLIGVVCRKGHSDSLIFARYLRELWVSFKNVMKFQIRMILIFYGLRKI